MHRISEIQRRRWAPCWRDSTAGGPEIMREEELEVALKVSAVIVFVIYYSQSCDLHRQKTNARS